MQTHHLPKEKIADWFRGLQDRICEALETLDGEGKFVEDKWEREAGGGGRSRVIHGRVIEKGGVNFSAVHGAMPEKISSALKLPPSDFFATGVSIVLHPRNPMVPIIHMNVRFFETAPPNPAPSNPAPSNSPKAAPPCPPSRGGVMPAKLENLSSNLAGVNPPPLGELEGAGQGAALGELEGAAWWFGGGIDLTPHYVRDEDARFFHQNLKQVCDKHDPQFYPEFKQWADDYFYLKHRKETRGIGGIFFDRLNEKRGLDRGQAFKFVQDVGEAFAPIYVHLAQKNKDLPFGEKELEWQAVRRSRYVEFNLLWDKGTKFGLDTDGRTESILMSMPPLAKWFYQHQTEPGSPEAQTLAKLKKGVEWGRE